MAITVQVNGRERTLDVEDDTPLLWVVRDELGLKGTKFGCGAGICGACTVHLDGAPARSCQIQISAVQGRSVTTIEGLSGDPDQLHPLQAAWLSHNVPQCGYCQSGQLMTAAHLLAYNPSPSDEDIVAAMSGNLCRCGTYSRILAAVRSAASATGEDA